MMKQNGLRPENLKYDEKWTSPLMVRIRLATRDRSSGPPSTPLTAFDGSQVTKQRKHLEHAQRAGIRLTKMIV